MRGPRRDQQEEALRRRGCSSKDLGGGLCKTHGGVRLCSHEGCNKRAKARGACVQHDSARRSARTRNAPSRARARGKCKDHGGVVMKMCARRAARQRRRREAIDAARTAAASDVPTRDARRWTPAAGSASPTAAASDARCPTAPRAPPAAPFASRTGAASVARSRVR